MGKRTAQRDTIIDITSDSQVNSNFPYRWSPASLTFNNYFYQFLYLSLTRMTMNNNAPHQKSPKNQNRRAALGRPAMKLLGGGGGGGLQLVCSRPALALSSALVAQTLSCLVCMEDSCFVCFIYLSLNFELSFRLCLTLALFYLQCFF